MLILLLWIGVPLFSLFKKAGATVSLYWQNSGHELRMEEFMEAKEWLSSSYSPLNFSN
jgi:predicted esterase